MAASMCFYVKQDEIDRMGIVHHSNYPIWFQAARKDFFNKVDLPNAKIRSLGFFLPLSEMKCKYVYPAKYGDEIEIITNITHLSYAKIKFEYQVLNKKTKKILAIGNTAHAWTNKNIKPVNIQKEAPKVFELLKQLVEPNEK